MFSSPSTNTESILDRFDDAWNGPTPPLIEDFLAASHPDRRLTLLIELIRIDLERRLAAGEKVRLEEAYLRRFPELSVDASALVTLVKHEFELRRRSEPELTPAEYLERFPLCQTELLAQLPTLDDSRGGEQREGEESTLSASAATELDLRGYELIETLGKGGMGEVYRCGDPALGRDLAIKVMKTAHRAYPEIERRFLREARVTASLQHPGIVPVYNLGRLRDGRLHYTMRLVRGQTLAAILKEEAGKPERLPYLLSVFEKICQAVAYAHSKHVIHRDLKPANVMVGRFGEVQVMDWGLAKLLTAEDEATTADRPAEKEGTRIYTEAADTPLAETRLGREMGTPAYMSPEQALGEWDTVDERTDVFGLGSILCEMLTGKPAYRGTESSDVYRRAKRGDITEALEHMQQCGADAVLTVLCRECLSPNRDERPRDAGVVADRVAASQAQAQERLRRAEVERAEAQAKAREERKKRRWVIAFLLVLLTGVSVSTWQAVRATVAEGEARENERRALAERDDKEIALAKAEAAAEAERQAKDLAQIRLGQIEKANEVLTSIFRDLDPNAEGIDGPNLRQQLSQHLERAAAQLDKAAVGDAIGVARLQTSLGHSLMNLGKTELSIELSGKAVRALEGSLGADNPETLIARNNLAEAYWAAGRSDEAIRLHEQNLKQCEAKLGSDHDLTLLSRGSLGNAYGQAGRFAEAIRLREKNLKSLEAKVGPDHLNTLVTRINLAAAYLDAGRTGDAITLSEQTLKQLKDKLGYDHPCTLNCRNTLALSYKSAGRTADAIRLLEQTLKQMEAKLGPDHPNTLNARHNLAGAYLSAGRTTDAIRLLEQTVKQREAKLGPDHADTLLSMASLGVAYRVAGRLKDAIPLLEQTLERGRKRSGGLPVRALGVPRVLADAYHRAGQFAKAEAILRDFLEQARQRFGPDDPRTAAQMAVLGFNLLRQHKYSDAEPLLRDCLRVRVAKQPDNWVTFNARSLLGAVLLAQRKFAEAEPLLLQGYEGMKAREAQIPQQGKVRLTEALERLVRLYEAMNKKDEAAKWRKKLEETKAAQTKPKP